MHISPDMEIAAVVVALIAYAAFREWLRHQKRTLIHRERLAAIEKGVDLPPLDQEQKRNSWNVQRTLLLAGMIWISLGICIFVTLSAIIAFPENVNAEVPRGVQWIGVGPFAIGISHLVVYITGKNKERRAAENQ